MAKKKPLHIRIRQFREKRGMSLYRAEKRVFGLHRYTLSQIESGNTPISKITVSTMCALLELYSELRFDDFQEEVENEQVRKAR